MEIIYLCRQQRITEAQNWRTCTWREGDLLLSKMSWLFVSILNLRAFVNYQCRWNLGFVPTGATCMGIQKPKEFWWRSGWSQAHYRFLFRASAKFWGGAEQEAEKPTWKFLKGIVEFWGSWEKDSVWDLEGDGPQRSCQNFK